MSAIWGVLDLSGKSIEPEICSTMKKPFLSKKIDKIQEKAQGPLYLSCGLQFVSDEAEKECYPYESQDYILTADAIVDNREELQSSFSMVSPLSSQGVDGSILFDCVTQDFKKALDAMLGAYVFALYNKKDNTLTLANDAVGTRSVYYTVLGDRFYFSSLLEPLLQVKQERKRNDQWFFNFYAQDGLCFVKEYRETPYEGVFRLEPGEFLIFSQNGITRKAYWDPLAARKELKLPDHEAYAQRVREVFGAAVKRMIRENRDAAILLSGGLDSNAVAAFAAPRLQEMGKKLYSFTSVPDADRPRPIAKTYYVADERSYVQLLQKKHPNLVPKWVGCNHFDYMAESRKAIDMLEIPYKTIPNMPWMVESYRRAYESGCSILLTGQYGNITISVGNYENLFQTLLKSGRFLELDRQARIYGKVCRRRRRWTYRVLLPSCLPQSDTSYDKNDLNSKYYTGNRKKLRQLEGKKKAFINAMCNTRPYMYDKKALRQVGETELKISLETGVIPRDPTRDKRLIEFVMSLPIEELCWNGTDRMLVRRDMEGLIPEEILKDVFHRGQQAVGANENLKENWPQIKEELRKEYETGHAEDFLNLSHFLDRLDQLESDQDGDSVQIVRMIYCSLCSEYLGNRYDR